MKITLNVYDKNGEVAKECYAESVDIMFGTVRNLMRLFKVDKLDNTAQIMKIVVEAWDDVTNILSECFPTITDEEWNRVKLKELVPAIVSILRDSFAEILNIPQSPKVTGE